MRVIELEALNVQLRDQILAAMTEPVLVTDGDQPVLVIRNILDDDTADELIARNPDFQASIRRARQQKTIGQVRRLADIRQKYEANEG